MLYDETKSYVYGLDLLSQQTISTEEYLLRDGLGSIRQLTEQSSAITMFNAYEPYGEIFSSSGSGSSSYGFAGEWTDETGLVHLRARYYSPAVGRFLSKDTWAGSPGFPQSLNRWPYVEGNPVNRVDPTGYYFWGAGQALLDSSSTRYQSQNIHIRIQSIYMALGKASDRHAEFPGTSLIPVPHVDLLNSYSGEVWEIKPWDSLTKAVVDVSARVIALNLAQDEELLKGITPVGLPFNWNFSPPHWTPGFSFPPEILVGTDDTGYFDIYAGQVSAGVILWWKHHRSDPRTYVPYPILIPDPMKWSERNTRPDWTPTGVPVPVPGYSMPTKPQVPWEQILKGSGEASFWVVCLYLGYKVLTIYAFPPAVVLP